MRRILSLGLTALLALPAAALAATPEEAAIQELQKQIQALSTELEDLSDRLDSAERHSSLDRINLTGDMRVKADSLHYDDITVNQGYMVDFDNSFDTLTFDTPLNPGGNLAGFTGGDLTAAQGIVSALAADPTYAAAFAAYPGLDQAMAAYLAFGQVLGTGVFPNAPANGQHDEDNDIMYTTRLRLNMKAKVWDNVNFAGRLTMYKNWGDSSGVKVFDSFNSFTMDGTNSGNTTSDLLHVERAYFDWNNIGGTPFYLSIGRRPSTYGPPTQYRENELRGGTPSGHVVNFNFDGITAGYGLEDATGIPGMVARFCYGQGFESEYGNGSLFTETDLNDTHLGGFNFDLYNDDGHFLQATLFKAWDVTDSFKGVAVMPFADLNGDGVPESFNTNGYITRFQGSEDLGDMMIGSLTYSEEYDNGFTWFASGGWTHTKPSGAYNSMGLGGLLFDAMPIMEVTGISTNLQGQPVVELESTGQYVKSDDWDKERDGYSVYVGFQTPAPLGKFGLEYNYGSRYWTPFTQAQDDVIGSKLAARGHVGEAYYIFDINPNMFLKIGAIYYDYEYTNSGSPVGKPHKVADVQDGEAYSLFPVLDKVWDVNASMTMKF